MTEKMNEMLNEFFIVEQTDTRQATKVRHPFSEILLILVIGFANGHNNVHDCLCFAEDNEDFFKEILPFDNGLPSDDTMYRVLSIISPNVLDKLLNIWVKDIKDDVISIDGKTLRRSRFKSGVPVHTVNAYSKENDACVGQKNVNGKGHEREGVKYLLNNLKLEGKIVTTDALSTNDDIIKLILKRKADYLLPVKSNRKVWYNDLKDYFNDFKKECSSYKTVSKNHGVEKSEYYTSNETGFLEADFAQIRTIGLHRNTKNGKVTDIYYISSKEMDAQTFAEISKGHWRVETMHQNLDVSFHEDDIVISDRNVASNLSIIRKFVLKYVKKYKEVHNIKKRSLNYIRSSVIAKDMNNCIEMFSLD